MEQFAYQAFLTPEEGGGFSTEIPDLPGCYSQGDDIKEAVEMAADAGRCRQDLHRCAHEGWREHPGRHTYVTEKSIKARLKAPRSAGRPKKAMA